MQTRQVQLRGIVERPWDVLVVVPKRDEVVALGFVFDFDPEAPTITVGDEKAVWDVSFAEMRIAFLFANSQKVADLMAATRDAIEVLSPSLAFCVGTAAGRSERVEYLDTVFANSILDITEWASEVNGLEARWAYPVALSEECARDLEDFVRLRPPVEDTFAKYAYQAPDGKQIIPRIRDGWVATTPFLHRYLPFLQRVWNLHGHLRVVDMESSGFVQACTSGPRRCPWFVIRTVSDFGTQESKRDDLRPSAGRVAGEALKLFLSDGVKRSHPRTSRSSDSTDLTLSDGNFFSKRSASSFFIAEIEKKLSIALEPNLLLRDITLSDLAELCRGYGAKGDVLAALGLIRQEYYESKYVNYKDAADIRSFSGDTWADDFLDVLDYMSVNVSECEIVYVGIGEGRDVPIIFPAFKRLVGIDVAEKLMLKARDATDDLECIHASAEDLSLVKDASFDLYVSLRTVQSTFFDIGPSIREAHRVLRPDGVLIVSIPAFFVDGEGEAARVVPGLIVPGTSIVNPSLPIEIGERVIRQLHNLAFTGVGFHLRQTEFYIYARK